MDRLGAGEEASPENSMIEAARNASYREWVSSFYAASDPEEWVKPVEDLSE